jgi:hypothetical protein
MSFDLVEEQHVFRVSSAWLSHPFQCDVEHIIECCKGVCCTGSVFWPSNAYPELGHCGHLGEAGCVLTLEERPITCTIFPIYPNAHNTLVMFQRSMFQKGMCKGAFNKGSKSLIETQKDGLIRIFGEDQYNRVLTDVLAGRDSYFNVPPDMWEAFQAEAEAENNHVKPEPRKDNKC